MKKPSFLLGLLFFVISLKGQQLSYEFSYDNTGNRIRRTVIQLNGREATDTLTDNGKNAPCTLEETLADGTAMTIYPNPTAGSVRFERSCDNGLGEFLLTDLTGKPLEQGNCGSNTLTLDLSNRAPGIYLLLLFQDGKARHYKIIKQ